MQDSSILNIGVIVDIKLKHYLTFQKLSSNKFAIMHNIDRQKVDYWRKNGAIVKCDPVSMFVNKVYIERVVYEAEEVEKENA